MESLPREAGIAALAGLVNAAVVLVNGFVLVSVQLSDGKPRSTVLLSAVMLFLVGGVAGLLLVRYGLVTPLALVVLADLLSIADNVRTSLETFSQLLLDPAVLGRLVVLVAVLAVVEFALRTVLPIPSSRLVG